MDRSVRILAVGAVAGCVVGGGALVGWVLVVAPSWVHSGQDVLGLLGGLVVYGGLGAVLGGVLGVALALVGLGIGRGRRG